MVFRLSEETQSFQDTVRRFFENECDTAKARKGIGTDSQLTNAFAALQLNEIYATRESALESLPELAVLAREIGRAVAPHSLLDRLVAGPLFFSTFCSELESLPVVKKLGPDGFKALQRGVTGIVRSPAFYHDTTTLDIQDRGEGQVVMSGSLRLVPYESGVAQLLYLIKGYAYLIDLQQSDRVESHQESVLDFTQPRARITLANASAVRIELSSWPLYLVLSRILVAAEILGACQKAFEMTRDYVQTRYQFSQPIGSFQVVQHALADIYQKIEMLDSLLSFSVWSMKQYSPQSELSSQALLRFALKEGIAVIEKSIQLHGGIGFTWEHDLHLYLRRVRSLVALSGSQVAQDEAFLDAVQQLSAVQNGSDTN